MTNGGCDIFMTHGGCDIFILLPVTVSHNDRFFINIEAKLSVANHIPPTKTFAVEKPLVLSEELPFTFHYYS